MRGSINTMVTVSGIAAAVVLSACGDAGKRTDCVVVDASGSTLYAQTTYSRRLTLAVEEGASAGGRAALVVAKGRPLVESDIIEESFSGLGGTERASEREAAISDFLRNARRDITEAVGGGAAPTEGSGVAAAIALIGRRGCTSVTVLSDGLETADANVYRDDVLTGRGRELIVARLKRRGRVVDLHGAELRFPFGGFVPQGSTLDRARADALPVFWEAYADASDAKLVWRR